MDGFTVGYEDLTITTDSTTYRQYNTLAGIFSGLSRNCAWEGSLGILPPI